MDKFNEILKDKKARIRKNKLDQLKNKVHELKGSSGKSATSLLQSERDVLKKKIALTRASTASLGRFVKKVRNEEKMRVNRPKQKFDPDVVPVSKDAERTKNIVEKVLKTKSSDVVNIAKAVKVLRREREGRVKERRVKRTRRV